MSLIRMMLLLQLQSLILFNSRGPSGSGIDMVVNAGSQIATIVGPEFDVIGFDHEALVDLHPASRSAKRDPSALARTWAETVPTGQLAGERDDGSLRFINTDNTARDMLRITMKLE
ncbi:hypothetical protein FB451DRAFT_1560199 [Mycena latifolia]|nr:hypothetical protein FB451DRAFT_1560199 [Mycena latifolia]